MFRFLHSSDLHLGKRFGNYPEELRGRLREARHASLGRLALAAYEAEVTTILLAGDTFDTETPSPEIRRQALAEMARHSAICWILLPGNHDSLQAAPLWDSLRRDAPENVLFALEDRVMALEPGVSLLPAPCTVRRPGRDVTEWMDRAVTPEGSIRIGLAHGAVQDFSEDGSGADIIAPNRASKAGLAYFALGDWHGSVQIDQRTYYSGTPEPDRFKHDRPGQAYIVTIGSASGVPDVSPTITGSFLWKRIELPLLARDENEVKIEEALPAGADRRQALVRIVVSGRTSLGGRTKLAAAIDHLKPEFAKLDLDEEGLQIDCEDEDLDQIDRAGALRTAADTLLAEAGDNALSASERSLSQMALSRLFSYCQQVGS